MPNLASIAVGCAFTADAIADSKVRYSDRGLEIRLPDGHFGIAKGDVRRAVDRLKWPCLIVIADGRQKSQPGPAAPTCAPITQADIDAELLKRREKKTPQMEAGYDLPSRAAAGGIK